MGKTTFILLAAVVLWMGLLEQASSQFQGGVISGGYPKRLKNVPWQASIADSEGYHICSGAIISTRYIITAAQCIDHSTTPHYVRTGSIEASAGGSVNLIKRTVRHELYNERTHDNDIGLVELSEPLQFSRGTLAIRLIEQNEEIHVGQLVQVTGWGDEDPRPNVLKEIEVAISDNGECTYDDKPLTSRMQCAESINTEEDIVNVCGGDVGAPVVLDGRLHGVVTWILDCTRPGTPLVYTNIATLRNWVDKTAV